MNDANNALAPCPFCGGRANIYEHEVDLVQKWSVGCGDCDANMDVCEDEKPDAVKAWNTRALRPDALSPATEVRREAIARIIGYHCASIVSGNNMPDMSGDPRKRIQPARRRQFDAACEHAADAILALPCADEAAIRADQREIDAKVADASARDAVEQIERNNKYYDRTGSRDTGANDTCRSHKITAEQIASAIRGGKQP